MKASVLVSQGDMQYMDWPEPELKPGHIKMAVKVCGICGSDIPRVWGTEAHSYPIILGHEFCGEVVEAAPDVTHIAVGDRVAGAPLLPCMRCGDCQLGDYALCGNYSFIGSRTHGAFAEYIVIPAVNAVKIERNVSDLQSALFEPASVALHGILRAGLRGGEDAVIIGTGNIGILAMQWARIFGARRVAVCDPIPERLALAASLNADAVFNPSDPDFLKDIRAYTQGRGFTHVFETAGQPVAVQLGFDLVSKRGSITCIGTPHKDFSLTWKQWEQLNRKEFSLSGTWMSYSAPFPGREWHLCAHYFNTGALALHSSMIYDTMPLSKIADAFSLFKTPGKVTGKLMIEI